MVQTTSSKPLLGGAVYRKQTEVNGTPTTLECTEIKGQVYATSGNLLKIARLEDEWYDDVANPGFSIAELRKCRPKPDIFTFLQRLPDVEPKYSYHTEFDALAVLPITTFEYWWTKQIRDKTRNMVRKSKKAGIEIRETSYDDDFVRGMTEIFNETPVRQGRRFWHYGKDFETIKRQFSQFLFREELIGAYLEDELVGFAMLADAGRYAVLGQIISKVEHRDKAINNALIARCIDKCASKSVPHLVYAYWNENTLSDFKRHCGFEKVSLPRYFVPLTSKGRIALKLGLHRDWRNSVPRSVKEPLKKLRVLWLDHVRQNGK